MYCLIYEFKVKPGLEDTFLNAWKGLTKLIYKHEGSLGSRLHKSIKGEYIAYAQWPEELIFKNAGENLPKEADSFRHDMRSSCTEIKTIYQLEVVEDLLKENNFKG